MSKKMSPDDYQILNQYLHELEKIPSITKEKEKELIKKGQNGDLEARNIVIKANLRYVIKVALEYSSYAMPFQDLINEGNIGLINAFSKFDLSKGYVFISYAIWWVRQAILYALNTNGHLIRLPNNKIQVLAKLNKIRNKEDQQELDQHIIEKVAAELGVEVFIIQRLYEVSSETSSLNAPLRSDSDAGDGITLESSLSDPQTPMPDQEYEQGSLLDEIDKTLGLLKDIEAKIIIQRFGLHNQKPMSLKELSEELHLSKERVRQIEKKALSKMRTNDAANANLDSFH